MTTINAGSLASAILDSNASAGGINGLTERIGGSAFGGLGDGGSLAYYPFDNYIGDGLRPGSPNGFDFGQPTNDDIGIINTPVTGSNSLYSGRDMVWRL